MRIGIDVGGTNTDAVLMDGMRVVGKFKTPTTADVSSGITTALRQLLAATGVPPARVMALMIGTTHFTNAMIERRRLQPVAALRLGLPATASLPPVVDWPGDLRDAIGNLSYLVHGGNEFDGRVLTPLDEQEVRRAARDMAARGITAVAVTAVFSPVTPACEEQAAAILSEEIPGVAVTRSHEIGRIGLLERENAAIMNACLHDLAQRTIASFEQAAAELGLAAPLYLTQNDGTLMSAAYARRFPVLTFASGPTNSMRGADPALGQHVVAELHVRPQVKASRRAAAALDVVLGKHPAQFWHVSLLLRDTSSVSRPGPVNKPEGQCPRRERFALQGASGSRRNWLEVGQVHGAVRPGGEARQVQNANVVQRQYR